MKRILFFLLLLLTACSSPSKSMAYAGWEITNYESAIQLKTDGNVAITETISVDFHELQKHGIYRDIPYVYQSRNGEKMYTNIAVHRVQQDTKKAQYKVTHTDTYYRIKIGDADKTISGKHTYTITYEVLGVLRSLSEYDEFYWNVTGSNWEADIEKSSTTFSIPNNTILSAECYIGADGSTESCEQKTINEKTMVFLSNRPLVSNEGLTIRVRYTPGTVPILKGEKPKSLFDHSTTPISLAAFTITLIGGIVLNIVLWWKKGRDFWFKNIPVIGTQTRQERMPLGAHETTTIAFEPPNNLRPAEIGVLMDQRADTKDVTATIIDLATRGFLTITEQPKKWLFGTTDYVLNRKEKERSGLLGYETMLLDKLFATGETIHVSQLKQSFYKDLAKVKEALYDEVTKKKLFDESPEKVRTKYLIYGIVFDVIGGTMAFLGGEAMIGPVFMGGLAVLVGGTLLLITAQIMPRRSAVGRHLFIRTKGYKTFISGAEKYRQQFFEKKNMFNDVLPYAIVFGLTGKFARAMEDMGIQPTRTGWYTGSQPFHTATFVSNVDAFSSSLSTAIASTPSSSGSGSSGGGFGGGGGGSW